MASNISSSFLAPQQLSFGTPGAVTSPGISGFPQASAMFALPQDSTSFSNPLTTGSAAFAALPGAPTSLATAFGSAAPAGGTDQMMALFAQVITLLTSFLGSGSSAASPATASALTSTKNASLALDTADTTEPDPPAAEADKTETGEEKPAGTDKKMKDKEMAAKDKEAAAKDKEGGDGAADKGGDDC